MKSRIVYIKKAIISTLFLLLLGGIIFNSTFFLHTHRTACGKLIVHAHPFNKGAEKESPLNQHRHNKIDLQVISSLQYFIDFEHLIEINQYLSETTIITIPLEDGIVSNVSSLVLKRGPPSETIFI